MINFNNKTVIIGVTGGIAAYKSAALASMLKKRGVDVHVIMTENACKFITPLTFEAITSNKCIVDTFDRGVKYEIEHISLAKKADAIIVAPATANFIGKIASGISDDMLTTTFTASLAPKIIAPAMNTNMYNNPVTQRNIAYLKELGYKLVEPAMGLLACGDEGIGKMPEPDILVEWVEREIYNYKDLKGKKILITAGATREAIDPVRFITNHSTGKMGMALAKEGILRGGDVTVVKGATTAEIPEFINIIETESAADMFREVKEIYESFDIIIKTAAVADYTPETTAKEKLKKGSIGGEIKLKKTVDILEYIGNNKNDKQVVCGFSMETENMIENSQKKLIKKNADLIIANNLKDYGSGFATDTNCVTFISRDGIVEKELMSKQDVAREIFDYIIEHHMK